MLEGIVTFMRIEGGRMKSTTIMYFFTAHIWLISWFAAIWSPVFKVELFVNGLFCLLLAMALRESATKEGE
jgi:hypothetical protein